MPIRLPSDPKDSAFYLKGYYDAKLDYEVQLEEKIGKWILIDKPIPDLRGNGVSYKCSVCGSFAPIEYNTPYCPNCGAKMEVK